MAAPAKPAAQKPASKASKGAKKGRWNLYETSGGLKRKNRSCPKCGTGTRLAEHKNRRACGKCGYFEKI